MTQDFTVEGLKKLEQGRDVIEEVVNGLPGNVQDYKEAIETAGSPKLSKTGTSLEQMVEDSFMPVMKEALESLNNAIEVQRATLRTLGFEV